MKGTTRALPLERARLLLPSYRLRYFAPAGAALHLLYGRDDLQPPRYDLALLAPRLMGAAATEVAAGPGVGASAQRGAGLAALVLDHPVASPWWCCSD